MANSRNKGAKAERDAAKLISEWTGYKFERTPSSGGLQWKAKHAKGDITCTEDHYCPFCFEIKFHKKIDFSHLLLGQVKVSGVLGVAIKNIDILDFWNQAKRDANKCGKMPILMMRYNGLPKNFWYVVVGFSTLVVLGGIGNNYVAECFKTMMSFKSEKNSLFIIPSNEFFTLPYKPIRKLIKNHLKNGKGKRK